MTQVKRNFLDSRRFQEEVAAELGIDLSKPSLTSNVAKKEDTVDAESAEDGTNHEAG